MGGSVGFVDPNSGLVGSDFFAGSLGLLVEPNSGFVGVAGSLLVGLLEPNSGLLPDGAVFAESGRLEVSPLLNSGLLLESGRLEVEPLLPNGDLLELELLLPGFLLLSPAYVTAEPIRLKHKIATNHFRLIFLTPFGEDCISVQALV